MPRWLILTGTHILVMSIGFAGGIYLLPILTAPPAPTEAALQISASKAVYVGRFARDLKGSDLLHWGVNRLPKRTPYRRAKGTPLVEQRDGYERRTVRAGCGVGRA